MMPNAIREISSGGRRRASLSGTRFPSTRNMGGRPALRWMSEAPPRTAPPRTVRSEQQEVPVQRDQQPDRSERYAREQQIPLSGEDRHREQDQREGDQLPAQLVAIGAARGLDRRALLHVLLRLEVLHPEEDPLRLRVEVADALLVPGQLEHVE